MVPTKRLIRNIYIVIIAVLALMGLIQGFWMFHAPLSTILIVELILMGAGAIAALIGWLVLRAIYPQLRSGGKKSAVGTNIRTSLLKEMQIEYELETDDALAFHLYNYEHSPQLGRAWKLLRRAGLFAIAIAILTTIVLIIAADEDMLTFAVALGAFAVLTFLYVISLPSLRRKLLRWAVTRDYGQGRNRLVGKHKLSITPQAVTDITDMGESMVRWNAIEYVASTDQYLFMLVRASSPYIVPRRAFSDEALFSRFVEVAKAYHQAIAKE